MVFSSLVFLFAFLPLAITSYYLFRNRTYRNAVLLVFSLLFYSWGEPRFIVLILLASLAAYLGGLLLDHFARRQKPGLKKLIFVVTVVLLTSNLLVFKYLNFFSDNLNLLFPGALSLPRLVLPIGISFYTFQILSYVIDLYRGEIKVQKNYFYLTLYVSFFPQLIAGPIVRYQTIEDEILHRQESFEGVVKGVKRFLTGLAKKVLIANNTALIAEIIYKGDPAVYGTLFYWVAALSYALQIYFDFSGYSDMAIGLGQMFGFHFLENFNYPYTALSVTDFWRRWHISLSTWFRDYIYIPLGGNRVKRSRWIFNLLVVWALTGFWHGAQWNFLLWGLYYGVILLLEKLVLDKFLQKLPKLLRWCYAMFVVLIGWVIFNLTDPGQMGYALKMMFSFTPTQFPELLMADTSLVKGLLYLPLGLVFSFPIFRRLKAPESTLGLALENAVYLGILAACIVFIVSATYNPFIYFRF
ncbi:MAG: MBOAT family protein [Acutalibacter sp.]|nr:MBOAT family protein [Acutalibacter sp.]